MVLTLVALTLKSAAPLAAPPPPPAKPKLICREGEQQTGTHMHAERVCKTAEQWDSEDTDVRRRLAPLSVTIRKDQLEGAPNVQPQ
jgi:hypothetical protein